MTRATTGDTPETVGPYRVDGTLGVGGMGEVLLAWDTRLERPVAIKRIRVSNSTSDVRRARFRREAKVSAVLSHPAIVPVFDLLTVDGVDHIVMEYVAGTSLREAIDAGSLSMDAKLMVARDVAAGLAHAHENGVVHRDLKTENVLLTPERRARIADFGIARRWLAEADDPTLTRTGAITGTLRAMAPEQARGEKADPRADLFSLGVLLYELFTGVSPFAADTGPATLARVLEADPPLATSVVPDLPVELALLIGRLLEKQPESRPQYASEVLTRIDNLQRNRGTDFDDPTFGGESVIHETDESEVTPLGTAIPTAARRPRTPGRRRAWLISLSVGVPLLAVVAIWWTLRTQPTRYIAILPTTIEGTASPDAERLGFVARTALTRTLARLGGIAALTPDHDDSASTPAASARLLAADEALVSSLTCGVGDCQIAVRRIDAEDGRTVWTDEISVPADDPWTTSRALSVLARDGFADYRGHIDDDLAGVSSADFTAYLTIKREFETGGGVVEDAFLERLAAIRTRSPGFVDVHALEADLAFRRFHDTRDDADLRMALARLDEARRLAPDDPTLLFQRARIEIRGGRLDAASHSLEVLEDEVRGDVRVLDIRAELLAARGETSMALRWMRDAAGRRPSWKRTYNHARAAMRSGAYAEARSSLDDLLDRWPDQRQGRALLAEVELMGGDLARAESLYRALHDEHETLPVLSGLGLASMLLGDHEAARQVYERLAEALPRHPGVRLNLADTYALLGDEATARAHYLTVIDLIDPDAATTGWEDHAVRAQALAQVGRPREAVAAIQRVLREAPEVPQAAFEAALVYAVAGDKTSATVHARRAIELGVEARWFALPWFDVLRADGALPARRDAVSQADFRASR